MTLLTKRPVRSRPTIDNSFDLRNNSLNFLRVVLAVAVIVSHGWPIAGFGTDPRLGGFGVGHWAVGAFFAISGFLVTASRVRLGFWDYLARRAARILPGFWMCLVFTAFVVAPITAWLTGRVYQLGSAVGYVVANATLVILQPGIGDTLRDAPYPDMWNGSLWTLKWEFLAYLAVGVAMAVPILRRRRVFFLAAVVGLTVLHAVLRLVGVAPDIMFSTLWLSTSFASGVILYLYRERIVLHYGLAIAAVAAIILSGLTDTAAVFAEMPVAYLLFWLAAALPLQNAFRTNDISYGMYIYAYVVQECLALAGVGRLGIPIFVLAGIIATVPLAYASWFFVEKPAKALVGRRR